MRRRMVLATNPSTIREWTFRLRRGFGGVCSYSVLLPAGLAVPPSLRSARWALTPPFQPCLCALRRHRRSILCGAIPRIASGGRYPPPYPRGARTFLPASIAAPLTKRAKWLSRNTGGAAVRPTGANNIMGRPSIRQPVRPELSVTRGMSGFCSRRFVRFWPEGSLCCRRFGWPGSLRRSASIKRGR
jgi:hypothetical protein